MADNHHLPGPADLRTAAQILGRGRGRRPAITRPLVIATALEIVDDEGLAALTMRQLAERLGVGLATVYNVAGSKEDILQGLVDAVLSEVQPVEQQTEPWDTALVDLHCELHELFLRHPGVAQLAVMHPVTGPAVLHFQETILRLLRAGGLDRATTVRAYTAITSYLMGFTLLRLSRHEAKPRLSALVAGVASEDFPELLAAASDLAAETSTHELRDGLLLLVRAFA